MTPISSPGSHPTAIPLSRWDRGVDLWLALAASLLGFFLLFSTAGTAIALVAMLMGCVLAWPRFWRLRLWRDPLVVTGLAFFAFIFVHEWLMVAMGRAPRSDLVGSYSELWRFPIVLAVFVLIKDREIFWRALLLGAVVVAVLHWLLLADVSVLPPEFFSDRRITLSCGFVAVSWIAWARSMQSRSPWVLRAISLGLALTVLFAMDGRTGHVLVVVLAAWAGWIWTGRRWRWLMVVVLPAAVIAIAAMSPSVQNRMADSLSVTAEPPVGGQVSSAGIRKEYYRIGLEIATENPWLGVGFAAIPDQYQKKIEQKAQSDARWLPYTAPLFVRTSNLHNEYLMLWAGTGIVGLIFFLVWLGAPLLIARASDLPRDSLSGLMLAFSVGCLFNAWLLDFTPGHVYVTLLAWLLSERYRRARA